MNITTALTKYGLTEREATLYRVLLEHTELSVFEIAKQTSIPRTTTYSTLESMKKQGLVNTTTKNNVVYYSPESPTRLLEILKEKTNIISESIPHMLALSRTDTINPNAKVYLGIKGIKIVLDDVLETLKKEKIPILYATSQIEFVEILPNFFPDFVKRREAIGTFAKLIVPESAREHLPDIYRESKFRETRFMPKNFPFSTSVQIYGHKTVCISFIEGEYHSVIIDSKTISDSFKQFFLFAWENIAQEKIL